MGKRKQQKMAATFYRPVRYGWWSVPTIANINAPTVSELNAGVYLGGGYMYEYKL